MLPVYVVWSKLKEEKKITKWLKGGHHSKRKIPFSTWTVHESGENEQETVKLFHKRNEGVPMPHEI